MTIAAIYCRVSPYWNKPKWERAKNLLEGKDEQIATLVESQIDPIYEH
jgi:hypothetical protein